MKKLIGLIAAIAIVGAMLVPATTASAAQVGAAVGTCSVTLAWPGSGSANPCSGQAVGAVLPGGPICTPLCTFSASVDSYGEECFAGEPPLLGDASGTLSLNGSAVATYQWQRVGVVAVLTLDPTGSSTVDAGAGVAVFAPLPPLGTCAAPNPAMTAQVTGLVAAVQAP